MLDRYSISASANVIAERFGVDVPGRYKPRYNAGPSQLLPIITAGSKGISYFYWGTSPEWAKNKSITEKIINVRAESIMEKPMFRRKLARFRCAAPCDGFYLWKRISKKSNVPYRFTMKSRELFSIAGFWEEFEDENGEQFHTFSLITCEANKFVIAVHERMPMMLDKSSEREWLDLNVSEERLAAILKISNQHELDLYPVSPAISSLDRDEPSLLLPSAPADQFGNLTLFD